MTMLPYRGKCPTCGHDHDADQRQFDAIRSRLAQPDDTEAAVRRIMETAAVCARAEVHYALKMSSHPITQSEFVALKTGIEASRAELERIVRESLS